MKLLFAALALVAAQVAVFAEDEPASAAYKQNTVHGLPMDGTVLFTRNCDDWFFMEAADGSGAWRVGLANRFDREMLKQGIPVRVLEGEMRDTHTTRRINKSRIAVPAGAEATTPEYRRVTLRQLYSHPLNTPGAEDLWGRLVECEGTVRDVNRRQQFTQIQVGEGDLSFQSTVYVNINVPLPDDLKLGAHLRVRGLMYYTAIDDRSRNVMTDFSDVSIIPNTPDDLKVISRAPFWTPGRIWAVTGAVLCAALLVTLWATVLRRKLFESMRRRVCDEVAFEATHRERLRLACDLHDDFQQLLAGTMFRIGAAENRLEEKDIEGAGEFLKKATESLNYTQTQLRTVLWGLNEESEGPASLVGLFHYVAERMAHWKGIVSITSSGREPKLARSVSGSLLMVLQEAVGNALTHGYATKVDVQVEFANDELVMTVRDNGVGFDVSKAYGAGHYGLQSMRERLSHLCGRLDISSESERGTTVVATIPLDLKKGGVK